MNKKICLSPIILFFVSFCTQLHGMKKLFKKTITLLNIQRMVSAYCTQNHNFSNHCPPEEKTIIVLFGPPGAGKGTLEKLCRQYNFGKTVTASDLCKKKAKEQTIFGQKIEDAMDEGELVSDGLIVPLIEQTLEEFLVTDEPYIIFDGLRTIPQAQALKKLVTEKFNNTKLVVVNLQASDKEVLHRLSHRYVCSECGKSYLLTDDSPIVPDVYMTCNICQGPLGRRKDDAPSVVKARLENYRQQEQPLLKFFDENVLDFYIKFCKDETSEEIFENFKNLLNPKDEEDDDF